MVGTKKGGQKKRLAKNKFCGMLTRQLSNAKKQRRGDDRLGYESEHTHSQFKDILTAISDSVVDYMEEGTEEKYKDIINVSDFTIWNAISPPLLPFDDIPKEGKYEGYVMSLCKCRSSFLRNEVRTTEETLRKWVSVRRSLFEDSGFGLFAEKTFKQDDIITVFAGKLYSSNSRHGDKCLSFKKMNGQVVHLNTMEDKIHHLYFGAHYANDPTFGMNKEKIAKISTARNVKKFNAIIDDNMCIVATTEIRKNVEVRLMYRPTVRGQIPDN